MEESVEKIKCELFRLSSFYSEIQRWLALADAFLIVKLRTSVQMLLKRSRRLKLRLILMGCVITTMLVVVSTPFEYIDVSSYRFLSTIINVQIPSLKCIYHFSLFTVDKIEALRHYKFSLALAFENSNVKANVTERFFQSLVARYYILILFKLSCYYILSFKCSS